MNIYQTLIDEYNYLILNKETTLSLSQYIKEEMDKIARIEQEIACAKSLIVRINEDAVTKISEAKDVILKTQSSCRHRSVTLNYSTRRCDHCKKEL